MKRVKSDLVLIGIILIIALLVRLWGIGHDLPYIYHPDEPGYVAISQNIFKTGDLNPHFFNYPSFLFYLNSLAYVPYYLFGKSLGVFATRNDILPPISLVMGVAKSPMATTILLGRLTTAVFGVGAVGLTFLIGKQLTGKAAVGLLAALLMAISPSNVRHSRFVTPDTFVVFFAAVSFLATVFVYQRGKTWHYVMAGVCIGLTASSKYNGGLLVFSLIAAHLLRHGKGALREPNLYLALLLCGLGFLATTPFALIDSSQFLTDLKFEAQHYSTGHAGMEGNTLEWYLRYMWRTVGIVYFLALLEILRGVCSRTKGTILLSVFPIVYFAWIASFLVRNDRTFLPLTPFLFLLAASFLAHLMNRTRKFRSKALRTGSSLAIACLSIASLVVPASRMTADTIHETVIDSRETARIWIDENVPAGARIAIEAYSPFVDPARFSVQGFGKMIDHEPTWYMEQGFGYLVFGEGMYGRFYQEPERYATEKLQYDNLFARFPLVMLFDDGGYQVRIHRVE